MSMFLTLAFLFFMGSVIGWIMELFYRRFSKANRLRKWVNPGFCTGPYLPIYGFGLCGLFLLSLLEGHDVIENPIVSNIVFLIAMMLGMTAIEYIAGLFCFKVLKVRLWDYTNEWGNIQGVICPKFSVFWGLLGAFYYFLIHPHILDSLRWLSENLAFSFVIGFFYGVLMIDAANSLKLVVKLRELAEEYEVVVRYEEIKMDIKRFNEHSKKKLYYFFRPFKSRKPLREHVKMLADSFEKRIGKK